MINILGFADNIVPAATTELYHFKVKGTTDNT